MALEGFLDGRQSGQLEAGGAEHQLAEYVTPWFDNVPTWVEIITGLDLDFNHRVYDANPVGAGLTFIEPPTDAALGLQISTSSVRPLRASEWARILELVRDGAEPPPEEVLSRDARPAQRRGADQRAVIDAATAAKSYSAATSAAWSTNCRRTSRSAPPSGPRSATTSLSPSTGACSWPWTSTGCGG